MSALFKYHELIQFLIEKDLKSKYRGSFFGGLWALIAPILHYFVICAVVSQFVPGSKVEYAILFLCGAIPFSFISNSLARAPWILSESQAFYRKAPLPKQIFILHVILFEFLQSLSVLGVFILLGLSLNLFSFSWSLLSVPLTFLFAFIFMTGIATCLTVLTVFVRDVGYLLPVFIQTLFFVSPVAYSLDKAPAQLQNLLLANPVTLMIETLRQALLHSQVPWIYFFSFALWSIGIFFLGQVILKHFDQEIVLRV